MPRRSTLLLCAACIALAHGSHAREEPAGSLDIEFRQVLPARTGGPLWMDAEFDCRSAGLLQGRLEAEVTSDSRGLFRYCSDDMALTAGRHSFRLMLPSASADPWTTRHTIRAAFRMEKGACVFDPQPVKLPQANVRNLVVCVAASDMEMRLSAGDIASSLRLERYDPESVPANARTYVTHVARLEPADLPTSPLPCCGFDVLVVPADAFPGLSARQLDALCRWAEGGGSLCVLPHTGLKDRHEQFLNALSASAGRCFRVDTGGTVEAGRTGEDIVLLRPGLGRAVVVLPNAPNGPDVTSRAWRRAVAHLWKVRADQASRLADEGRWTAVREAPRAQYRRSMGGYDTTERQMFGHVPLASAGRMSQHLMPQSFRMVPARILLLVFLGFLAAIGPVDYWLFGRLKKRALTWLLFPALSIGCAGLVVYLSGRYIGSQDHVGAFVFVDVDRSGRVLRWSRCELQFGGRARRVEQGIRNALFAPLERDGGADPASDEADMACRGRYPFDFAVSRHLKQWDPVLSRSTSFEPIELPTRLNWHAVDAADLDIDGLRTGVHDRLCDGTQFCGSAFVLRGGHTIAADGRRELWSTPRDHDWVGIRDILRDASARPAEGFFTVVSQVSPGDATTLEDLSVLDSMDPRQALLVAVEWVGRDCYVYRCLFCGED